MSLSCICDDNFDYYATHDDDFSILEKECKCKSCGKLIKPGNTVLKFTCWRHADEESDDPADIAALEDGDVVHLDDEFFCERCGEIYLNLHELGYCLSTSNYMPDLLREYHLMTGFEPEKYR